MISHFVNAVNQMVKLRLRFRQLGADSFSTSSRAGGRDGRSPFNRVSRGVSPQVHSL